LKPVIISLQSKAYLNRPSSAFLRRFSFLLNYHIHLIFSTETPVGQQHTAWGCSAKKIIALWRDSSIAMIREVLAGKRDSYFPKWSDPSELWSGWLQHIAPLRKGRGGRGRWGVL